MVDAENQVEAVPEWVPIPLRVCPNCEQPVYVKPYTVHDLHGNPLYLLPCRRCHVRGLIDRCMHVLTMKPKAKAFETSAEDDE